MELLDNTVNYISQLPFEILIIIFLLLISAFFSGSETALTAVSSANIHGLSNNGDKGAKRVEKLIADKERLIGAILLGNNSVNILASSMATVVALSMFENKGITVATIIMTFLILLFSELLPKTLAISNSIAFAKMVSIPMRICVFIFAPITNVIQFIVRIILLMIGIGFDKNKNILSATDELRHTIDLHHDEGRVDKDARNLIRGALDLEHTTVEESMIHRKFINMLDINLGIKEIINNCLSSTFTRIPIWKNDPDNILGIIHMRDLFKEVISNEKIENINIESLLRKPYFIPHTANLQEQLDAFRNNQEQFALVLDEYGALRGLVTMEDILEEIVGEIEDEHDKKDNAIKSLPQGKYQIAGDITIRDLNRSLDWDLPDEEAITIAGLIIHEARIIPEVGQLFTFHNFQFEILEKRRNQISKVKVTKLAK